MPCLRCFKGSIHLPALTYFWVLSNTAEQQEVICENTPSKQATLPVHSSCHFIPAELSCICKTTGEFLHPSSFLMLHHIPTHPIWVKNFTVRLLSAGQSAFPPATRCSWHYVMLQKCTICLHLCSNMVGF